jgi:hypothetical protein
MSDQGSVVGRRLLLAGLALFGLAALWPPLNHDAGAVLGFAQRMLAGEKLYTTLIDVNPPLVFLLSLIPAWAARATGASAPQLLCGFVLLLAFASVWLSLRVLAQGKLAGFPVARALAAPALLIALLAAPMHSFTQREHLLAIFTLPYLFAAGQRLDGGAAPRGLAIGVAAFAAIGLLLKPHFVAIAALVELGCLIARGPTRGLRAPEPWVMLGVAALYLAVVLIGFPAYVFEILPLARGLYDHADSGVFLWILIGDQVPALALVLVVGAGAAWRLKDGVLAALTLALAGAILAAVVQGKGWDYHFLCARILAILLAALAVGRCFGSAPAPRGLVAILALLTLIGSGALSPPFKAQREFATGPTNRLLPFLRLHAPAQPVLWLTGAIYPQYPALPYNDSPSAMTYMSLWMLPSLYGAGAPVNAPGAMGAFEKRLFDDVGTSLSRIKPPLVIVADPDSEGGFAKPGFDYLAYFQRHPDFAAQWSNYRPIGRVDRVTLYRRSAS